MAQFEVESDMADLSDRHEIRNVTRGENSVRLAPNAPNETNMMGFVNISL